MKTITMIVCIVIAVIAVSACKSGDPSPERIAGAWEFKRFKAYPDSTMKETAGLGIVIFNSGGALSYLGYVSFPGGWCNQAEQYSLDGDILRFQFSAPNCIPLIDPRIPETAQIIEHTGNSMTIQWGRSWMQFERK